MSKFESCCEGAGLGISVKSLIPEVGRVAEWFKAPVLKCVGVCIDKLCSVLLSSHFLAFSGSYRPACAALLCPVPCSLGRKMGRTSKPPAVPADDVAVALKMVLSMEGIRCQP
jgi:hypothetical protein